MNFNSAKKHTKIFVVFVLMICFVFGIFFINSLTDKFFADESKTIDMYLIGGQSNAAGYSKAKAGEITPSEIYNNIGYAGQVDRVASTGSSRQNWLNTEDFKWCVQSGYGVSEGYIGPEYGMAKYLSQYYSVNRKAFIFKSAAGGTALHDDKENVYGNWYPRSLWPSGYVANVSEPSSNLTGVQYALFIENFRKVYNGLKKTGYSPRVMGVAWMQGENDLGRTDYADNLAVLINDMRRDLIAITNDTRLYELPFAIGKIATTFASYNNAQVPEFNRMQQNVADTYKNVETVETSDLIIVGKDRVNGTDSFHFNINDAVTLGERFAECLYMMETDENGRFELTCNGGEVEFSYDENTEILTLYNFMPHPGMTLSSIAMNEKTLYSVSRDGAFKDDKFIIDLCGQEELILKFYIQVTFIQQKYKLNIENDDEKGVVIKNSAANLLPLGQEVLIIINPKEGYGLSSVKFNGKEIYADQTNYYHLIIEQTNNLVIEYIKYDIENSWEGNKSGRSCKGTVSYNDMSIILLFTVALIKMRRK